MNFPYSKKWIAISMASLLVTSASVSAAATTEQTPQSAPVNTVAAAETPVSVESLTVAKAIEQALKTNTTLQNKRLEAKNADINSMIVNDTVGEIPSDFIDSLDAAQQKYVTEASAKMAKKLNELAVKAVESNVKLGAQKAYYDLLHAEADLELKKQSLARAQMQLKVATAAFEVGTKAKTDVLQAEMGVAGAQAALAAAENNLEIARMKLNQFLGVDLQKRWKLSDDNKALTQTELTLEKATELALQQRIEIVQRQEELKLAELKRELIAKYSALSTYQGRVSSNDVEKAKLAVEEQKRTVSLEVAEAYYNLNAARLAVEFQKKAMEAAAESYRLTNLRFENGLSTTLEIIQAEEELSERENQYQQANRNYNLAVVNFETALGK